jgi:hypothetical protein
MKRILLGCALLAALALPVAAAARADGQAKPGYLVVHNAAGDGGVNGHAIVTLIVHGFVLGSISPRDEARIDIYQLVPGGQGAPQTTANVSKTTVSWKGRKGQRLNGIGFRFRAMGGYYRVVVRGSGVYLYAGGVNGRVTLHGSSFDKRGDGKYSIDGRAFRSLPTNPLTREIGRG